jgi:hypothetical protein
MRLLDRLVRPLKRQSPRALITRPNPAFDYDLQRLRKTRIARLTGRDLRAILGFVALVLIFWLCGGGAIFPQRAGGTSYFYIITSSIAFMALAASIVATILADLSYVLATVNAISPCITSGQWDVLRLTALREKDILTAKYAVALIRAWPIMQIEMFIRTFGVLFLLFPLVSQLLNAYRPARDLSGLAVALAFFLIFGAVHIVEPLWRVRAFTAMGLAVSARIHDSTFAALAGLGSLLAVRLVQGAALWMTGCGLLQFVSTLVIEADPFTLRSLLDSYTAEELLITLLACLMIAFIIYASYKALEIACLQHTLRLAFQGG